MAFSLKRYMPRSFYARAALILLTPVIVLQIAVGFAFLQRHFEDVTAQMTRNMARDMRLARADPGVAEGLGITLGSGPVEPGRRFYDLSGRALIRELHEQFEDLVAVDLSSDRRRVEAGFADGVTMSFRRNAVTPSNPHQLLVLMVIVGLLMSTVSILFMRGQIRPIRRLARAAEAFGRGEAVEFKPTGATEVRAAGHAFLDMRARIERHIDQRTLLLSGVSHDLRTPLTRMKLELSMMDGEEAEALGRDVAAMERIIDTFLDFSRSDATDARVEADVTALVREAAEMAAPGGGATVRGDPLRAPVRPEGIRRAVANLVGNALRHGTRADVRVEARDRSVSIVVEDDGPGIPEAQREAVTRPFARLDAARTNTRGNVGLGLSIVRDVARAHGGSLRLGEATGGGLRAEIVLPR
ncbi:HAMP domain-containing protein [Jannaschia sp. Os4]|uniref:ATP-binding protein n=1 Tax=Jannaschia sp. Os4 TaxID=2807617 RepID=UPI00193A14D7|nr:ATP-binding protein [Jannaschia sp. Os4]MBM2576552.1 HAMP domain-containing protein [Jannaschia sp. Os4]